MAATCEEAGSYDEVIKCSICGEEVSREHKTVVAIGHDFGEWVLKKAPTEKETGLYTRACKNDASHVETKEIPVKSHVHTIVPVEEVKATCTIDGMKAHYMCKECGFLFEDEAGNEIILDESALVIAKGHKGETEVRNPQEATCDKAGYTGDTYCKACNTKIADGEKIVALGHAYGSPVYEWSSDNKTCTAIAVCKNDGCTDAVEGHKVTETVNTISAVKTDSTTEKKGVTTYTAIFTNKLFEKQSKDIEDIALKPKTETPVEQKLGEQTATEQKPTETTTTTQTPAVVEKGKEVTVEKKGTFEVTSKNNTVEFTSVANTKAKSVTIPDTVTVDGKKYEVTEVSTEALKNSSATTVTIGKNVTTLAPEAFKGSNVKTITIKSKNLTKKSVKNAFKGLKVKKLIVKIKVGSKKENKKYIKKYKKFFTKKNIGVKAVIM